MLVVLLVAVLLLSMGLAGVCVWFSRLLREAENRQRDRESVLERRIRELDRRLDAYLTGSVKMGEELQELRRVVAPLPDKLNQIEQRDPSSLSFTQAARLAGMGASVDELTQSCGLSQGEAELISKMQQARR
ncbi:chemotaxis protein [Pseudomonas sp. TTU2014-080ASC]|nr:chemotaxis protein [Pseudomonas sp. TTU2014-080ASC]